MCHKILYIISQINKIKNTNWCFSSNMEVDMVGMELDILDMV